MSEPRTETGRLLLAKEMSDRFQSVTGSFNWPPEAELVADILAIEAEAAALDAAEAAALDVEIRPAAEPVA